MKVRVSSLLRKETKRTPSYLDKARIALRQHIPSPISTDISIEILDDISLDSKLIGKGKNENSVRSNEVSPTVLPDADVPAECPRCHNRNTALWWYTAKGRQCWQCGLMKPLTTPQERLSRDEEMTRWKARRR